MGKKKPEIKTRKKSKPIAIKKRKPKVKIKKRVNPEHKRLAEKYPTTCGGCKRWHHGPIVERDEDEPEARKCPATGNTLESTNLKGDCSEYDGDWVAIPNQNRNVIRDADSPPRIRRRKKKAERRHRGKFAIQRREV